MGALTDIGDILGFDALYVGLQSGVASGQLNIARLNKILLMANHNKSRHGEGQDGRTEWVVKGRVGCRDAPAPVYFARATYTFNGLLKRHIRIIA